jgi:hypothetical protein
MADIRSRVGAFIQGLAPSQQQAAQDVASANRPEESEQRTSGTAPVIGTPGSMAQRSDMPSAAMPQDLQQGYLRLNEFGSPLPRLGVLGDHYLKAAQVTQDQMTANEQMLMTGMMPQRGQLPVGMMQQPVNQKGGRR